MTRITVTVPATTANLGPGFDCIGAALTRYNRFSFTPLADSETEVQIAIEGGEAAQVGTDADNLVYRAFTHLYQSLGQTPPPVAIEIQLGVPLARGLGSSATAIVGGLVGANCLAGNLLTAAEVMNLAIAIEGHPDNVVPALLGNCQLASGEPDGWQICQIPWHPELIPVVAIPDFELSTEAARAVLPATLPRSDAIFNVSRFGLLLRGLELGRGDWLRTAMQDKIHQPYRQSLIEGYREVERAVWRAGGYGMVISGAGPTLLALTSPQRAEIVAEAMAQAWHEVGIACEVQVLALDAAGATAQIS